MQHANDGGNNAVTLARHLRDYVLATIVRVREGLADGDYMFAACSAENAELELVRIIQGLER